MKKTRKIKVIGAGGIGSHLIEPLARYLSYVEDNCEVTIIDGDKFEDRNKERQRFLECSNKAEQTVAMVKDMFPKIHFRAKGEFITEDNIITTIRENDEVFLCVDNHASRKLVSNRCEELQNVTLISGGNDYEDGNVMMFIRKDGKNVTRPLTQLHKAIADPADKNPGKLTDEERMGCQQEAQTHPQLITANFGAAFHMLCCYRNYEQNRINFEQVYFDTVSQRSRTTPEKFSA